MTRSVCYFFPVRLDQLYNAYKAAAGNARFRRECKEEPYHTLTFGLNFSMKYNFNGGACILHFMPFGNGSAVDLHFTIAQLAGARYERYAKDLTGEVEALLRVRAQPVEIDEELFLKPENKHTTVPAQETVPAPAPVPVAAPVSVPVAAPAPVAVPGQTKICANCGNTIREGERFCGACGTPVARKRFCTACGAEAMENAAFCGSCGCKL